MSKLVYVLAKIEGLRTKVISRLNHVSPDIHFEATTVLELFEQYAKLQNELKMLSPDLYSDLPSYEIPNVPDENGEYKIKGCVPNWELRKLLDELNYIAAVQGPLDKSQAGSLWLSHDSNNAVAIIDHICICFHSITRQLQERHDKRETLKVDDEYDVQDLLHALLKIFFDDVRDEDPSPNHAGATSRVDLVLKKEQIIIEVKKTRANLKDKKLGEQLIIDIERYKVHPNCKMLYCFVYDPDNHIKNPTRIENDLSRSDGPFPVKVFIAPK